MLFEDTRTAGVSFAKDPAVAKMNGRYYLYYTRYDGREYSIGIAVSDDLTHYDYAGTLSSELPGEGNGICAPAAVVIGGTLHLFYQSYGQFPKDYICHASSKDGVHFTRDPSNPVFKPRGDWNCGRAIDADVVELDGKLLMYWATRDPEMKIQMLGIAEADINSGFSEGAWTQLDPKTPVLKPELDWEQNCIEASAACVYGGKIYMFYAGAYNCSPQQIGCAVSDDGVHFTRLFVDEPFLKNGKTGSWNESESGHPYIFQDGDRYHLMYQGSDDQGRTWRISRCEIAFDERGIPYII